jgi:uncharacterized protein YutE (UPF0331/DUF86 family)
MTDAELIAKKLAQVETYLTELAELGDAERLESDLVQRRFVERTLQMAVQAALDAASHVVSDDRLGEPASNRELFELLARAGWLPDDLAHRLGAMAGFRYLLVHDYAAVDLDVVRQVMATHTQDLLDFVAVVRRRLVAG